MLFVLFFFVAAITAQRYEAERTQLDQQYQVIQARYEQLEASPPNVEFEDPAYVAYEEQLKTLRRELHSAKRLLKIQVDELTAEHAAEMKKMRLELHAEYERQLTAASAAHRAELEALQAELVEARESRTGGVNVENNVNVHVNVDNSAVALELERLRLEREQMQLDHARQVATLRREAQAAPAAEVTPVKSEVWLNDRDWMRIYNTEGGGMEQRYEMAPVMLLFGREAYRNNPKFARARYPSEAESLASGGTSRPAALNTCEEMMALNPAIPSCEESFVTKGTWRLYLALIATFRGRTPDSFIWALARDTVVFRAGWDDMYEVLVGTIDPATNVITVKEMANDELHPLLINDRPFTKDTRKASDTAYRLNEAEIDPAQLALWTDI